MNRWVIDCSLALSWCLPDETSPAADRFFSTQHDLTLLVPSLFWYEAANALTMATRKDCLTRQQATTLSKLFQALPLTTSPCGPSSLPRLMTLASTHNLSAYDASYLDLAIAQKSGLATTDKHLHKAARKAGIHVFE
jgi:predicted nucleic acid-binding protein